jgi:hypothetical protein
LSFYHPTASDVVIAFVLLLLDSGFYEAEQLITN